MPHLDSLNDFTNWSLEKPGALGYGPAAPEGKPTRQKSRLRRRRHPIILSGPAGWKISLDPLASFYRKEFAFIQKSSETSIVEGVGESLPFRDGTFNCIVSDNVLDHTADVRRVLGEIRRTLKEDGVFLLGINLYPFLYNRYAGIFRILFSLKIGVPFKNFQTHTYFFIPHQIERLLVRSRFMILKRELPPRNWIWFPKRRFRDVRPFLGIFVCSCTDDLADRRT